MSFDSIPTNNSRIECRQLFSPSVVLSGITTIVLAVLTAVAIAGLLPHAGYLVPFFGISAVVSALIFYTCIKCRRASIEIEEYQQETSAKFSEALNSLEETRKALAQQREELAKPTIDAQYAFTLNEDILDAVRDLQLLKFQSSKMDAETFEKKLNELAFVVNDIRKQVNKEEKKNFAAWSLTKLGENINLLVTTFEAFASKSLTDFDFKKIAEDIRNNS